MDINKKKKDIAGKKPFKGQLTIKPVITPFMREHMAEETREKHGMESKLKGDIPVMKKKKSIAKKMGKK